MVTSTRRAASSTASWTPFLPAPLASAASDGTLIPTTASASDDRAPARTTSRPGLIMDSLACRTARRAADDAVEYMPRAPRRDKAGALCFNPAHDLRRRPP